MFNLDIQQKDKDWLKNNYPALLVKSDNEISGSLVFKAVFEINGETVEIADKYEVRIVLDKSIYSDLPQVFETSSRIKKVAKQRKVSMADLHVNPTGTSCLCFKLKEPEYLPNGFNLEDFFNNLVIPFFYGQSYFEQHGVWPWEQYAHGVTAFFEWYIEQKGMTRGELMVFINAVKESYSGIELNRVFDRKNVVKGHHLCICGSLRKYRKCHNKALLGLWKLKKDIQAFDIET